jgi:tRNA 2-thiouridine synthesizing protein B
MLHIVNKSPTERNALESCLATVQAGGAVLLIEDGVYGATRGSACEPKLRAAMAKVEVYALAPDLEARGMANSVSEGVKLVDYSGFVELVTKYNTCQSWL